VSVIGSLYQDDFPCKQKTPGEAIFSGRFLRR
jgi:hypothetical protein